MAGARIEYTVDDSALRAALARLAQAGADLRAPFATFGEHLDLVARERWDHQVAPDGSPWQDLKRATWRRKRTNQILVESRDLRDTLRYVPDADELAFGTDRLYGATHQFGADERGIPARPFLGITDEDEIELTEILKDWLRAAIG